MRLPARIGFPLLAKELTEQAAQRRTYVIRVLYACALFVAAYVMFSGILSSRGQSAFAVLGQGREMFDAIVLLEFIGIYLFMPAMASGVIAVEKERNTLGTLLLTRLGPMTIVLEKYLSRLVPLFTFLLLSLPLMAFTYSLGGVTQGEFWTSVALLALSGMQIGALAVACSAFARTAAGAFVGTYLLGLFVHFLLPPCSGLAQFQLQRGGRPESIVGFALLSLFSVGALLTAARVFLVERAFLEPRNVLLEIFRSLDQFFTDLNKSAGGIVLVKDDQSLPADKPITWRETQKKSLGTARYLFRVLSAIETPLLLVLVWTAGGLTGRGEAVAPALLYIVWVIALLLVTVKATSVVAGERSRQTLDVLLVTPLPGAELLRQKASGVRRLIGVLWIPFFTIYGFEWSWAASLQRSVLADNLLYLAGSVLTVMVYLPLGAWLSTWLGIVIRSQTRAIILSVALIFGWVAVPFVAGAPAPERPRGPVLRDPVTHEELRTPPRRDQIAWGVAHPAYFVRLLIARNFTAGMVAGNVALHLLLFALLRTACLRRADRLLGRLEPRTALDDSGPTAS
ncbi:MAG TPA: ABC transporter permease subunit [Planctomycetaceae bacterium]|nr:ABC transporter permease subunit [Planctomycetaceae bacterium]